MKRKKVMAWAILASLVTGGTVTPMAVSAASVGEAPIEMGNSESGGNGASVEFGSNVTTQQGKSVGVVNNPVIVEDAGIELKDLDKKAPEGSKLMVFDVSNGNEKPEISVGNASSITVNGVAKSVNDEGRLELPNKGKYKVVLTETIGAGATSSSALYVVNLTSPPKNGSASLSIASKNGFKFSTDLKETIEDAVSVKGISGNAKVKYYHTSVDSSKDSVDGSEWVSGLPTTAGKFRVKAVVSADLAKYYLPQETKSVMMTISKSSELITAGKVFVSTNEVSSEVSLPLNLEKYAAPEDDLTKGKVELTGSAARLISGKPEISADGKLLVELTDDAVEKTKSSVNGKIKIKFSDLTNCTLTVNCDFVVTPNEVIDITVDQDDGVYGSSLPTPEAVMTDDRSVLESKYVRFTYSPKGSKRMTSVAPTTAGEYVVQADYSSGSGSDKVVGCATSEFKIEKFELNIVPKMTPWTDGMAASKLNEKIGYEIADGEKLVGTDRFLVEPYYKVDTQSYTGIENDCPVVVANKSEALASLANSDSYEVTFDEDQVVRVTDEGLVIQFGQNAYVWGDIVTATVSYNREIVTSLAKLSYTEGTTQQSVMAAASTIASSLAPIDIVPVTTTATKWTDGLPSLPGTYVVKAEYGVITTTVPLEIAKKTVTITPKDVTIAVNGSIPSVEYSVEGVGVEALKQAPTFKVVAEDGKTSVTDTKTAGEYKIVVATEAVLQEPDKYQAIYKPGKLTITGTVNEQPDKPTVPDVPTDGAISDAAVAGMAGIDGIFRAADGSVLANKLVQVGNVMYLTDSTGKMVTSRFVTTDKGNTYYVTKSGAIAAGKIITVNGKKYFCNADGTIAKGNFCTTAKGSKVYAKKTGVLVSNAVFTKGGKKYLARKSCAIARNCFAVTKYGNKVCARSDGSLYVNGLFSVNGQKYYAKKSGALVTNKWVKVANKKYYCSKSGKITKTKRV